ncbi:MAG: RloB family protein [Woeseiaceae bacterium]
MPKKKPKNRIPLIPVFHIFCEGEKTEPYYIKNYISHFHSENRNIIVVEDTNKNTPVQLVEEAIRRKAKGNEDDVYWVVFDRESITKYPHSLHMKARTNAENNNIEIAFSNVCFEYWLLLHLTYTTACYESCSDLLHNSQFQPLLKKKGITDYNKGFFSLFDTLKDDVQTTAFKNSARLKQYALDTAESGKTSPCYLNPYTDVHELFIDIGNFINKKVSCR